jgi:hypothetical protein
VRHAFWREHLLFSLFLR